MAELALHLSGDDEADAFVSKDPLALLIGMVLDQQVKIEQAFWAPLELSRRLGGPFSMKAIAATDPATFAEVFSRRPALHRYPGSMAARVQAMCQFLLEHYGGDPTKLWSNPASGTELLERVKELPGFGDNKAKIFVALLGKQLGIRPEGWIEASHPYSESGSHRSVADIVDPMTLGEVRAFKQSLKAAAKATAGEKPKTAPTRRARAKG